MKSRSLTLTTGVCLMAMIAFPMIALAEPGEMMHVSISGKVQMSDPPMTTSIPAIDRDVCSPKQVDVRHLMNETSHNKNCSYTNYKQIGDSVSFHYACTGEQQLDGDGTFTVEGGSMHGKVHAKMDMHGMQMVTDMTYTGTRTGATCQYTPPKSNP